jgi:iron complex outermembrane receptor protein
MTSIRSKKTLAATLLLGAATPTAALAAAEAAPTDVLDTITVLASRIGNRTAFDSPVPVDVYTPAETLAALVTGDTGAALQALSPSVNMPRVSASGTSDAVRAIQLRGLAPDQTLVLINGKRRHTNAVMDFEGLFKGTVAVDLNTIPASAIDHLEILRDGAGAIYGSDAIAGVVNVVLKSGAEAGSAEASFGEYRTHFAPTGTTITDGRNRTLDADTGFKIGEQGWLRIGATVQDRGATQRAGRSDAYWTSWNATDADVALNDQVVFRSGDPEVKNRGLFYNLSLPVAGAELYSFATLNQRKSRGAAFFRYPGDPSNVLAIYPNGFLPVSTNDGRDLGVVAGLRGDAGAWHWDASVRDGYNTFSYGLTNTLNASLGAASPTSFHVADFTTEQRALNLDVTRSLPLGNGRNLDLALGAEYLGERYHTSPGDPASYAAGPFFANEFGEPIPPGAQGDSGLRPADTVHLKRNVTSLYLDADVEVLKGLNLGAAARYSDYSDYGSSTTGKFTLRYAIAGGVVLRGAVSSSFRAPALAQTGIRFASLNFNGDGTGLANNAWLPPGDPIAVGLGATPLKPERSTNSTLGLAWRAAGTSASVDFYQIRIRDRITPTGALQSDGVSAYLADAGATDIASVTFLTNALDTTTRGVDVVVSHERQLLGGTLLLRAAFNHNSLTEDHQRSASAALAAIDPSLALLDPTVLVPLEYSSPKSKLILTADWSGERHGLRVQATRFGTLSVFTYDDSQPTTPVGGNAQPYSPVWSLDVEGRASFTPTLEGAIGGTNVFNHYPDRTTDGGTYGGAFPYNYTHPLGINGAYYYVRLRYRFGH